VNNNALENWIGGVRASWGPLSSAVVADCRRHLEALVRAPATEDWLAALHRDAPLSEELYRDADHGFVLLAHTEPAGLYRPPHDHGRGWVIYAIQQGEIEMATYARIEGADGRPQLVKRDSAVLSAGMVQAYLPGDIHDTTCLRGPALLFRFTERDLRIEDREAHQITRYIAQGGIWTVEPS